MCRGASLHTLTETRLPAAWALAEATARTSELPSITASDVDLPSGSVRIHGSSRTRPRRGFLSDWGIRQLKRRLDTSASAGAANMAVIYKAIGVEHRGRRPRAPPSPGLCDDPGSPPMPPCVQHRSLPGRVVACWTRAWRSRRSLAGSASAAWTVPRTSSGLIGAVGEASRWPGGS
jgi:integrase